jgi:hypothetical protein
VVHRIRPDIARAITRMQGGAHIFDLPTRAKSQSSNLRWIATLEICPAGGEGDAEMRLYIGRDRHLVVRTQQMVPCALESFCGFLLRVARVPDVRFSPLARTICCRTPRVGFKMDSSRDHPTKEKTKYPPRTWTGVMALRTCQEISAQFGGSVFGEMV